MAHLSTVSTSFCIMIAKEGERQYVWGSSSSPSEFSNAASAREESALSERERGGVEKKEERRKQRSVPYTRTDSVLCDFLPSTRWWQRGVHPGALYTGLQGA